MIREADQRYKRKLLGLRQVKVFLKDYNQQRYWDCMAICKNALTSSDGTLSRVKLGRNQLRVDQNEKTCIQRFLFRIKINVLLGDIPKTIFENIKIVFFKYVFILNYKKIHKNNKFIFVYMFYKLKHPVNNTGVIEQKEHLWKKNAENVSQSCFIVEILLKIRKAIITLCFRYVSILLTGINISFFLS